MNKSSKKFVNKLTALAIVSAFLFQQVAWANPAIELGWISLDITKNDTLHLSVEDDGDGVLDTEERQLSPKRQWQRLTFPLEIILSFGLHQDARDHKDPKQTGQRNAHLLGKSLKEITSQTHSKYSFVKIEQRREWGQVLKFDKIQ